MQFLLRKTGVKKSTFIWPFINIVCKCRNCATAWNIIKNVCTNQDYYLQAPTPHKASACSYSYTTKEQPFCVPKIAVHALQCTCMLCTCSISSNIAVVRAPFTVQLHASCTSWCLDLQNHAEFCFSRLIYNSIWVSLRIIYFIYNMYIDLVDV